MEMPLYNITKHAAALWIIELETSILESKKGPLLRRAKWKHDHPMQKKTKGWKAVLKQKISSTSDPVSDSSEIASTIDQIIAIDTQLSAIQEASDKIKQAISQQTTGLLSTDINAEAKDAFLSLYCTKIAWGSSNLGEADVRIKTHLCKEIGRIDKSNVDPLIARKEDRLVKLRDSLKLSAQVVEGAQKRLITNPAFPAKDSEIQEWKSELADCQRAYDEIESNIRNFEIQLKYLHALKNIQDGTVADQIRSFIEGFDWPTSEELASGNIAPAVRREMQSNPTKLDAQDAINTHASDNPGEVSLTMDEQGASDAGYAEHDPTSQNMGEAKGQFHTDDLSQTSCIRETEATPIADAEYSMQVDSLGSQQPPSQEAPENLSSATITARISEESHANESVSTADSDSDEERNSHRDHEEAEEEYTECPDDAPVIENIYLKQVELGKLYNQLLKLEANLATPEIRPSNSGPSNTEAQARLLTEQARKQADIYRISSEYQVLIDSFDGDYEEKLREHIQVIIQKQCMPRVKDVDRRLSCGQDIILSDLCQALSIETGFTAEQVRQIMGAGELNKVPVLCNEAIKSLDSRVPALAQEQKQLIVRFFDYEEQIARANQGFLLKGLAPEMIEKHQTRILEAFETHKRTNLTEAGNDQLSTIDQDNEGPGAEEQPQLEELSRASSTESIASAESTVAHIAEQGEPDLSHDVESISVLSPEGTATTPTANNYALSIRSMYTLQRLAGEAAHKAAFLLGEESSLKRNRIPYSTTLLQQAEGPITKEVLLSEARDLIVAHKLTSNDVGELDVGELGKCPENQASEKMLETIKYEMDREKAQERLEKIESGPGGAGHLGSNKYLEQLQQDLAALESQQQTMHHPEMIPYIRFLLEQEINITGLVIDSLHQKNQSGSLVSGSEQSNGSFTENDMSVSQEGIHLESGMQIVTTHINPNVTTAESGQSLAGIASHAEEPEVPDLSHDVESISVPSPKGSATTPMARDHALSIQSMYILQHGAGAAAYDAFLSTGASFRKTNSMLVSPFSSKQEENLAELVKEAKELIKLYKIAFNQVQEQGKIPEIPGSKKMLDTIKHEWALKEARERCDKIESGTDGEDHLGSNEYLEQLQKELTSLQSTQQTFLDAEMMQYVASFLDQEINITRLVIDQLAPDSRSESPVPVSEQSDGSSTEDDSSASQEESHLESGVQIIVPNHKPNGTTAESGQSSAVVDDSYTKADTSIGESNTEVDRVNHSETRRIVGQEAQEDGVSPSALSEAAHSTTMLRTMRDDTNLQQPHNLGHNQPSSADYKPVPSVRKKLKSILADKTPEDQSVRQEQANGGPQSIDDSGNKNNNPDLEPSRFPLDPKAVVSNTASISKRDSFKHLQSTLQLSRIENQRLAQYSSNHAKDNIAITQTYGAMFLLCRELEKIGSLRNKQTLARLTQEKLEALKTRETELKGRIAEMINAFSEEQKAEYLRCAEFMQNVSVATEDNKGQGGSIETQPEPDNTTVNADNKGLESILPSDDAGQKCSSPTKLPLTLVASSGTLGGIPRQEVQPGNYFEAVNSGVSEKQQYEGSASLITEDNKGQDSSVGTQPETETSKHVKLTSPLSQTRKPKLQESSSQDLGTKTLMELKQKLALKNTLASSEENPRELSDKEPELHYELEDVEKGLASGQNPEYGIGTPLIAKDNAGQGGSAETQPKTDAITVNTSEQEPLGISPSNDAGQGGSAETQPETDAITVNPNNKGPKTSKRYIAACIIATVSTLLLAGSIIFTVLVILGYVPAYTQALRAATLGGSAAPGAIIFAPIVLLTIITTFALICTILMRPCRSKRELVEECKDSQGQVYLSMMCPESMRPTMADIAQHCEEEDFLDYVKQALINTVLVSGGSRGHDEEPAQVMQNTQIASLRCNDESLDIIFESTQPFELEELLLKIDGAAQSHDQSNNEIIEISENSHTLNVITIPPKELFFSSLQTLVQDPPSNTLYNTSLFQNTHTQQASPSVS